MYYIWIVPKVSYYFQKSLVNFHNPFKSKKKPVASTHGVLFSTVNLRKLKGPELTNIKFTIKNYVGDGVLTNLISSKANQIKDDAVKKCHKIIETGYSSEEAINKAGLIMLGASFKIKGLEELVDEIKFFARPESGSASADCPSQAPARRSG